MGEPCGFSPDFRQMVMIGTFVVVLAIVGIYLKYPRGDRREEEDRRSRRKLNLVNLKRCWHHLKQRQWTVLAILSGLLTLNIVVVPLTTTRWCDCRSFACLKRHKHKAPNFWIGGCQKCGTTSLYEVLLTHPDIRGPEPKEPGFFTWPAPVRYFRETWYLRKVLGLQCDKPQLTFDATAYYLQQGPRVARNILAVQPRTKAILVFREPIARSMSWLQHMALKYPHLPNCLHSNPMACCVTQSWFRTSPRHLYGSLYFRHLTAWIDAGWPIQNIHILRFEDIIDYGFESIVNDVLRFLHLDPRLLPAPSSSQNSTNTNRRSTHPYNISLPAYRDMVAFVKDDVASLTFLVGRDFGWPAIWDRQLLQCKRDGICQVHLLPPKQPRRRRRRALLQLQYDERRRRFLRT